MNDLDNLPLVDAVPPGAVTTSRAADILGISKVYVRALARKGKIKAVARLRGTSGGKASLLLDEGSVKRFVPLRARAGSADPFIPIVVAIVVLVALLLGECGRGDGRIREIETTPETPATTDSVSDGMSCAERFNPVYDAAVLFLDCKDAVRAFLRRASDLGYGLRAHERSACQRCGEDPSRGCECEPAEVGGL